MTDTTHVARWACHDCGHEWDTDESSAYPGRAHCPRCDAPREIPSSTEPRTLATLQDGARVALAGRVPSAQDRIAGSAAGRVLACRETHARVEWDNGGRSWHPVGALRALGPADER